MRKKLGETDNILFYLIRSFRRKLHVNYKKQVRFNDDNPEEPEFKVIYSVEKELIDKENITERNRIIKKALNGLSDKQREILYYRYSCGFEYSHICDIMSLKYDSARKLVFRAVKSLKESLSAN